MAINARREGYHATLKEPTTVNGRYREDNNIILVQDAIESIGNGPFQRSVFVAAGLCLSADAIEILLLSFLTIVLRAEWGLTDGQAAVLTSSVFAGALMGTLLLGILGDHIGRRPIFILAASIVTLFGLGTAMVSNFEHLVVMRFLVGFGIGGSTVPFDTLAEVLPSSSRGTSLLSIYYFWTIGALMVPLLAYLSLGREASSSSWRLFVISAAIPAATAAVVGMLYVPESPRWLCASGRSEQALAIWRQGAVKNGMDHGLLFPDGTILTADNDVEETAKFQDLFTSRWRAITLHMCGASLGLGFLYYGTVLIVALIFSTTATRGEQQVNNGEGYDFDYLAIFFSCSSEILGIALVFMTVDRGRVLSLIMAWSLGGLIVALLCFSTLSASIGHSLLVALAFSARMLMMAGSCTHWIFVTEILPTRIRARGHSVAYAMARIGGFLSPYVVKENMPMTSIGMTMLLASAVTTYCVWRLPETRGQAMGAAVVDRQIELY